MKMIETEKTSNHRGGRIPGCRMTMPIDGEAVVLFMKMKGWWTAEIGGAEFTFRRQGTYLWRAYFAGDIVAEQEFLIEVVETVVNSTKEVTAA